MKYSNIYSFLAFPIVTAAFSSIPAGPTSSGPREPYRQSTDGDSRIDDISNVSAGQVQPNTSTSSVITESAPWRIAMDIGREPLARMPFDWARSGCRMPLVVPTDFATATNDQKKRKKSSNILLPKSKTVSFTGPDGAVTEPIQGGNWLLSRDCKELTLSYTIPEKLTRRDVYIDGGTELVLSCRVYTQAEMDRLNEEYYQAREQLWQAGGELGDIFDRQDASKKWNEEKGQWEKRYPNENPLNTLQKRVFYWGAKAKQGQKMSQRPDINTLSNRGPLPGVERGIYFAKNGVVRAGTNGPVCGTWSAEPITTTPASYRGNS